MFRNSIFPFKINNLDIVKHKVVDIEMDQFFHLWHQPDYFLQADS